MRRLLLKAPLAALILFLSSPVLAAKVAIIIDDIGYQPHAHSEIAALPYPINVAILPQAPYAQQAAYMLHQAGKELLLHLPMQGTSTTALEPVVLNQNMSHAQFTKSLRQLLDSVDFIQGFNNHQGSVLTADATKMQWLMAEIAQIDDFYFIDSRTTAQSKALQSAQARHIKSAQRDIFLDHLPTRAFFNEQFDALIARAKKNGSAIAIAHPHALSLELLKERLPQLAAQQIELVFVSDLVR